MLRDPSGADAARHADERIHALQQGEVDAGLPRIGESHETCIERNEAERHDAGGTGKGAGDQPGLRQAAQRREGKAGESDSLQRERQDHDAAGAPQPHQRTAEQRAAETDRQPAKPVDETERTEVEAGVDEERPEHADAPFLGRDEDGRKQQAGAHVAPAERLLQRRRARRAARREGRRRHQERQRQHQEQRRHGQRRRAPSGPFDQHQEQAGADGRAEIGAADLRGIAPAMVALRQRLDRMPVAGDVDGRGGKGDQYENADEDDEIAEARKARRGQAESRQEPAGQDDRTRAAVACRRRAIAFDRRRPQELEHPGQHRQIGQADMVQRQPLLAQHARQGHEGHAADHALADIEPADRHDDRRGRCEVAPLRRAGFDAAHQR